MRRSMRLRLRVQSRPQILFQQLTTCQLADLKVDAVFAMENGAESQRPRFVCSNSPGNKKTVPSKRERGMPGQRLAGKPRAQPPTAIPWSESVAPEVLVFVVIGPRLLDRIGATHVRRGSSCYPAHNSPAKPPALPKRIEAVARRRRRRPGTGSRVITPGVCRRHAKGKPDS
jgi:hypothetical protein